MELTFFLNDIRATEYDLVDEFEGPLKYDQRFISELEERNYWENYDKRI
jgi:hypothetical protein